MKTKKWLSRLHSVLSDKKRAEIERCDSLKCVLKKLKQQQQGLKEKIKDEKDDDKRRQLKKQLAIIHAQRRKGVELLKEAKKT